MSSFDEVTPSMVNAALAGAKFLGNIFNKSKGETAPPADLMQKHHRPSLYAFRSMHAGEVFLLIKQLLKAILPCDLWEWYLGRAGRLAAAKSWRDFVDNYFFGIGNRLPYGICRLSPSSRHC